MFRSCSSKFYWFREKSKRYISFWPLVLLMSATGYKGCSLKAWLLHSPALPHICYHQNCNTSSLSRREFIQSKVNLTRAASCWLRSSGPGVTLSEIWDAPRHNVRQCEMTSGEMSWPRPRPRGAEHRERGEGPSSHNIITLPTSTSYPDIIRLWLSA